MYFHEKRCFYPRVLIDFIQTYVHWLPSTQQKQNICIKFIQCWANVEDVGPTLYKCYTNVMCDPGGVTWQIKRPVSVVPVKVIFTNTMMSYVNVIDISLCYHGYVVLR